MKNKSLTTKLTTCAMSLVILLISTIAFAESYRKPLPSLSVIFNPKYYDESYSIVVASQIYDRLFDFDEFQNIKPSLAEKWESSDNNKTWTIHLRKGVLFHDGKPFTAEDVKFTLYKLLEPDSVKKNQLSNIKGARDYMSGKSKIVSGVNIVDPYTIRIDLENPDVIFLSLFATINTEIVPNNYHGATEKVFFEHPIGTSAFMFQSYTPDKEVVLVSNDKYFGGRPFLDEIVFEKADTERAIEGFNQGYYHDLEWYFNYDLSKIKSTFTMVKFPAPVTNMIFFNLDRPLFQNIHIRKAIAYAIDIPSLVKECFPGRDVAGGLIPPGIGGYDKDVKPIPFDLAKAKVEIVKSGLNEQELDKQIVLLRPSNHICGEKFTSFIESSLKKISLNVNVRHMPYSEIGALKDQRQFDILNLAVSADHPEGVLLLNKYYSTNISNYTKFSSKQFDKLIEDAALKNSKNERYDLYKSAQKLLQEQVVVLPIYYNFYESIYQRYIKIAERSPYSPSIIFMKNVSFDKKP